MSFSTNPRHIICQHPLPVYRTAMFNNSDLMTCQYHGSLKRRWPNPITFIVISVTSARKQRSILEVNSPPGRYITSHLLSCCVTLTTLDLMQKLIPPNLHLSEMTIRKLSSDSHIIKWWIASGRDIFFAHCEAIYSKFTLGNRWSL